MQSFLDAGPPPVYVGFGSMPMQSLQDATRAAVEAIRAQGRRTLVSHGWADLSPTDDRDDCFALGDVNHQALFRRVAAVVHHGGAGTTTAAASAGAPQVVVPQIADQPYWAGRIAALGIGFGARRSDTDRRVLVRRSEDGADPRDPHASGHRSRHDPHRRSSGGGEAAA